MNPEHIAANSIPEDLTLLDKALREPRIDAVLDVARAYNALFDEVTPSDVEKEEAIAELDSRWDFAMDTYISFSGSIEAPVNIHDIGMEEGDVELKTVFLDEELVVSKGFTIHSEPQYVGDLHLRDRPEVRYLIYVQLATLYPDKELDEDQMAAYTVIAASIEQSLVDVYAISPERARAWIEVTHPELLEEIEARILTDRPGYDDPLIALHGLRLDSFADMSDDITRRSIESYLNHVLSFDQELPYAIDLHGSLIPAHEGDDQIYTVRNSRSLAKINQVKVLPDPLLDEDVWGVAVHIQLYGPDHQGEVSSWLAPVSTLRSVVSMRRAYYEQ